MPHFSRFTYSIAVLAVLALLLPGFSPLQAEASAASTQTKRSASVKSGNAAKQKKTAASATRRNTSTQTNAGKAKKPTAAPSAQNSRKTAASKAGAVKPAPASGKKTKNKSRRAARNASASRGPYKSAVLYNASTGQVIFSRNPNTQVPPASLTKILSMYVALDTMKVRRINPASIVTVSAKAASAGGSRMGLHTGDKVRLDELLRGMAVSSGNDASVAVAEYIGKSEAGFVAMMNRKARQVGMRNSVFKNANGLPAKGQFTTARDMLALARRYISDYPENLNKYHCLRVNEYNGCYTANANPLLGSFAGADGLKTGYVDASGYNLIATAQRGQVRIIGVILGAPTSAERAHEASALMEAGFGKLACPVPPGKKEKAARSRAEADTPRSTRVSVKGTRVSAKEARVSAARPQQAQL